MVPVPPFSSFPSLLLAPWVRLFPVPPWPRPLAPSPLLVFGGRGVDAIHAVLIVFFSIETMLGPCGSSLVLF